MKTSEVLGLLSLNPTYVAKFSSYSTSQGGSGDIFQCVAAKESPVGCNHYIKKNEKTSPWTVMPDKS